MFPQVHRPGEAAQSDFTHIDQAWRHPRRRAVPASCLSPGAVYSNVEAVQICFSESFESLVECFETCLWQLGESQASTALII
jgi:hypothetical protein